MSWRLERERISWNVGFEDGLLISLSSCRMVSILLAMVAAS